MDMAAVDAALASWRQGDILIDVDIPFVTFGHAGLPLTRDVEIDVGEDPLVDLLTDEPGYVIISQTCDIVRSAQARPYVEISPLVEVSGEDLVNVRAGRMPRYAAIPATAGRRLVADLDRTMVVEKPLLAALPNVARMVGCPTDGDTRRLAQALARKHARFAFPDDFSIAMRPVTKQIVARHGKLSPIGGFLNRVTDIRALSPNWNAPEPEVTLLFLFDTIEDIPADADEHIGVLIEKFAPTGAFTAIGGQSASLETMTAARYLASDSLDFDRLSEPDIDS
ncbi:hypothetical protein [Sphingobium yanoikuyae]|uniref:hypothetical protein n=1 Tax=Sphingobium yanoikuyae TaxID=13690 RepID=UPI0012379756|nr:hypothetical protein [Sphingobium yanoikuyae]